MPRIVGKYNSVIAFYDKNAEFGWMANTYQGLPVTIDGVIWPSTEHYFHAMKFPGNSAKEIAYREAIRNFPGTLKPNNARKLIQDHKLIFDTATWDGIPGALNGRSHEVMRKAVDAKLTQYPQLMQSLLQLNADPIIVEATANDQKWADGNTGKGTNHLGIIFMEKFLEKKYHLSSQVAQERARVTYQQFNDYRQSNHSGRSLYDFPISTVQQSQSSAKNSENRTQKSTPSTTQHSSFFARTGNNPQAIAAGKKLVKAIQSQYQPLHNKNFVISKGLKVGTFKVGFENAAMAQFLIAQLAQFGLHSPDVTYYGSKENYPMDENGNITRNGKFKHIVRFEIPSHALRYLKHLNINDAESLYNSIMSNKVQLSNSNPDRVVEEHTNSHNKTRLQT